MDLDQLIAWMIDGARTVDRPDTAFQGICDGLADSGVALARGTIFVRTLHPELVGRRFRWRRGRFVEVLEAPLSELREQGYLDNPIHAVMESREPIRRRLGSDPHDFAIFHELFAEGITEYVAHPLPFTDGTVQGVSWMTERATGFSDAEIESLERVRTPLARLAEVYALKRTATNLLNTYVGRDAGARILAGSIQRGDTESIHAAVLFSDLRGFTHLSNTHDGSILIGLLNQYFDAVVGAVEAAGGEVLKFLGDGVLAIFPFRSDADAAMRCGQALEAARDAVARLEQRNRDRTPVLACGIALHVGDIAFGNVGSSGRLDFTAIGPAVNLAARLDDAARDLGRTIVTSSAFAAMCDAPLERLADVELRGFPDSTPVYGTTTEAE